MGQSSPLGGLAAAVEAKRKLFEAQAAASGDDAKAGLRAAKPKDEPEKPKAKAAAPTPVEQMPKDEVEALRVAELKQREARERARQGSKR